MKQEPKQIEWSWIYLVLLLLLTVVVMCLPYAARHYHWRYSANWFLIEDGPYESLGAVAILTALLLFCWSCVTLISRPLGQRARATEDTVNESANTKHIFSARLGLIALNLGWAVLSLFTLGEEINWGERLLSFRAPEWFLSHSSTGEFNLHNLEIVVGHYDVSPMQIAWNGTMLFWMCVMPLFAIMMPRLRQALLLRGLIFPSIPIALAMLMAQLISLFTTQGLSDLQSWAGQLSSEVMETQYELMIFFYACEVYRHVAHLYRVRIGAGRVLAVASLPMALSLILLLGIPSTEEATEERDMSKMSLFMGNRYRSQGEIELAIAEYKKAIEFFQNNHYAHRALGEIYLEQGQPAMAAVYFDHLAAILMTDSEPYILLGTALSESSNIEAAYQCFRIAVELSPESAKALLALSEFQLDTNQVEAARNTLNQVLRLDPENRKAKTLLERLHRVSQ